MVAERIQDAGTAYIVLTSLAVVFSLASFYGRWIKKARTNHWWLWGLIAVTFTGAANCLVNLQFSPDDKESILLPAVGIFVMFGYAFYFGSWMRNCKHLDRAAVSAVNYTAACGVLPLACLAL